MKPDARSCPDARELHEHARGGLAPERTAAIRAHVAQCPDCRAAAADEHDSGVFGRLIRDWRARMPPEERQRVIDDASRTIDARRRDGGAKT